MAVEKTEKDAKNAIIMATTGIPSAMSVPTSSRSYYLDRQVGRYVGR
jgi:hypothetical protein